MDKLRITSGQAPVETRAIKIWRDGPSFATSVLPNARDPWNQIRETMKPLWMTVVRRRTTVAFEVLSE